MSLRYENLLSPIQVAGVLFKNRMCATAGIPHMLQGTETWPTERVITHIANRAKNGAAAVYVNFAWNGPKSMPGRPGEIQMNFPPHDIAVDGALTSSHNYVCQLIDMIRYYESIAITQPNGSYTRTEGPGGPGGPGPGGPEGGGFDMSDPIKWLRQEQNFGKVRLIGDVTKAQVQEYIDSTIENAKLLRQFGYEMFSIHCAYHNNTISEFWSADSNNRSDEYGGSVKNRARMLLEVFDALRQTFGRDFPLECLISAEGPGVSVADTIELAKMAEGKIDILHIRHGMKDPQHPVGFTSSRENPCPNLAAAAAVRQGVRANGGKMLIGVSAGLQNAALNESIIKDGKADLICMSRAFICEPEYGKKLYQGRGEDVTPCIRCNKCHVPNDSDKFRSFCSVNPKLGLETKLERVVEPVERKKKVGIVGGGPAGMKAAIVCAERGHEVTLYEKGPALGGQLTHADYPSFKWALADFKNWLIRQTHQSGVKVLLNTQAEPDMLKQQGFDEVIVAIGPRFKVAPLKGLDKANYLTPMEVYGHEKELPENIVVVGGSETGTETGMYLAENGHKVTVLTREPMLANDAAHAHYVVMLLDAYENLEGFSFFRNIKSYIEANDKGVTFINEEGKEQTVKADLIVMASGVATQPEQCSRFASCAHRVHYIGDCNREGDVHKAITAGFAVASQI